VIWFFYLMRVLGAAALLGLAGMMFLMMFGVVDMPE
jgi:hypothetical protein